MQRQLLSLRCDFDCIFARIPIDYPVLKKLPGKLKRFSEKLIQLKAFDVLTVLAKQKYFPRRIGEITHK
jgi:hypothetical protein